MQESYNLQTSPIDSASVLYYSTEHYIFIIFTIYKITNERAERKM